MILYKKNKFFIVLFLACFASPVYGSLDKQNKQLSDTIDIFDFEYALDLNLLSGNDTILDLSEKTIRVDVLDLSQFSSLEMVWLGKGSYFKKIIAKNCKNLSVIGAYCATITEVELSDCKELKTVSLRNCDGISTIAIQGCEKFKRLVLSDTKTSLHVLDLSLYNQIKEIDLMRMTHVAVVVYEKLMVLKRVHLLKMLCFPYYKG